VQAYKGHPDKSPRFVVILYNICKAIPNAFSDGIESVAVHLVWVALA
jgi:hypothetical protein